MQIAVVIPTYNEKDNISTLLKVLLNLPLNLRVVVVDDNSQDGTGQVLDEWHATHPCVVPIHRSGKLGLGTALLTGMKECLRQGADLILTMDADFSHHPAYIPSLVEAAQQYDLVLGSRYVPGGGTKNCTWKRILISRGANVLARTIVGLHAMDCTAGFRCYRRAVLEQITLDKVVSSGFAFEIEFLYLIQQHGYRIGEVPIIFENRNRGRSKATFPEIMQGILTVLRLGIRRLRRKRRR